MTENTPAYVPVPRPEVVGIHEESKRYLIKAAPEFCFKHTTFITVNAMAEFNPVCNSGVPPSCWAQRIVGICWLESCENQRRRFTLLDFDEGW